MRRSRALVLLAALALAGLTARLGVWQLDRAGEKRAVQQEIDERRHLPPLASDGLARDAAEAAAQHYRHIAVDGRWLAGHTVYLDNRPLNGHVGFVVVTPLVLPDGSAVLVQRGWLERDPLERTKILPPVTPAGVVRVTGRVAPPPARLYEFDASASGPIRQNVDMIGFGRELRLVLRPVSIQQLDDPATPADGLIRDWPLPAADVHKNYGYAFQWFALSTLTIALYAWFQLIRPRRAQGCRP